MDLSLLDTLKEKLTNGKNFGEVWEYFLDHFGEKARSFSILANASTIPCCNRSCRR